MTREEAKRELRPLKEMSKDIQAVEDEINRLMTVATKMTTNLDALPTGSPKNKIEEALIKIEEYRGRLTNLLLKNLEYRTRCLAKVEQIYPASLRKIIIYYYFQNLTLEQTAEQLERSYQWTYTMLQTSLDKYSEIT